jgi:hypothetical protein
MHFFFPFLIVKLAGLSGDCPVFAYRQSLEHIASHGIITVAVTTLTLPRAQKIADSMKQIIDWMDKTLPGIVSKVEGAEADLSRLVVSGHSSAAHVVVNLINTYGCGAIKGMFLLSPIDGSDPWGIIKVSCSRAIFFSKVFKPGVFTYMQSLLSELLHRGWTDPELYPPHLQ